jgi:hypothetical protein
MVGHMTSLPNHLQSRTVRSSSSMSSMVAKRAPLRPIFRVGNNQKSLGAMCGSVRTHRATHRLLCSNSSPSKAFLWPPNHRTLRISLRVTFGSSIFWKWASRGRVSQPWKISSGMRRPNSGRFQKKPSAGASNSGNGASVCVCVCVCVCVFARARAQGFYFEGD